MVKPVDRVTGEHGPVTLYVTAEDGGADRSLRRILSEIGLSSTEPYPRVLAVPCDEEQLRWVCQSLSPFDRARIVCHVAQNGQEPTASQLMQSLSLQRLNDRMDARWIDELLSGQRLVTYFQPIISNHRPDAIYAYECLLRGVQEDGQLIPPLRMIAAARDAGLLPILDQAAQLAAIESASKAQIEEFVFINFNPRLLDLATDCVDRTIQASLESSIPPARFVFEVVESDEIIDRTKLLAIIKRFREAGIRVALDDVGAGYNSLNLLAEVHPDFVKLDMDLVRGVHKDRYKSCVARKLLELSRELGVLTVAEGVETFEEWQWTRDHGADLAQGFLFARPAAHPIQSDQLFADLPDDRATETLADLVPIVAVGASSGEVDSEGSAK